jgi:DNA processing protein
MSRRVMSAGHQEWPDGLKELTSVRPPEQLFIVGQPLPPVATSIAIVGTRRPTAAGLEVAAALASGLVEAGFAIVSGMAVGIDAAAHRAALDAGGHTVGVVGCGLDVSYPRLNAQLRARVCEFGTLVGEYPDGTPPRASHFPERNRIIAGLSTAVVFVEGSVRSGGRITARLALETNRSVFAVPGSVRNPMAEGPNELIRTHQAALVTNAGHIFEELAPALAWMPAAERPSPLSIGEVEDRLLEHLDDVPVSTDELVRRLAFPPGRVVLGLAKLEVRGLVARAGAGYEISEAGARLRAALTVR